MEATKTTPTQGDSPPPGDQVEPDTCPPPGFQVERNKRTRRGQTRRNTEDQKKTRRERKKAKRESKRKTKLSNNNNNLQILTRNLQGISTRERNRDRLRRTVEHARQQGWDVVLVSEMRSEQDGVIWLGEGDEQAVVVHSMRSGVILRGEALKEWIAGKQQKSFAERVTTTQIGDICLVSVYQHLWSNGVKGIEKVRKDLENEIARTPKGVTLIIGGDFNSHVGRQSQRDGVCGKYGLSTRTGEAGSSLLDWCEENSIQHVNTFYHMPKRGTWFNQMHKKWYELDGFLMKPMQRHRLVKKLMVMQDMTRSDHKPVSSPSRAEKRRKDTEWKDALRR